VFYEIKKLSLDLHKHTFLCKRGCLASATYLKIPGLIKTQIMIIGPPAVWRAQFVDMPDAGQTKSPYQIWKEATLVEMN